MEVKDESAPPQAMKKKTLPKKKDTGPKGKVKQLKVKDNLNEGDIHNVIDKSKEQGNQSKANDLINKDI